MKNIVFFWQHSHSPLFARAEQYPAVVLCLHDHEL